MQRYLIIKKDSDGCVFLQLSSGEGLSCAINITEQKGSLVKRAVEQFVEPLGQITEYTSPGDDPDKNGIPGKVKWMAEAHLSVAADYERLKMVDETRYLRYVSNLLYAILNGDPQTILPRPEMTVARKANIMMNLKEFSQMNLERSESPNGFNHQLGLWSLSDWFTAVLGELGEAANVAKKLNRVRDGIPGNDETEQQLKDNLARELADTFIYLDLLCQSVGVDLSEIVPKVFDAKSKKIGYEKGT